MDFSIGFILDVILAAALAGVVWKAWRAGFVSAFISLIGTLAGYLGAAVLSGPLSRRLYVRFGQERVLDYVAGRLPEEVAGVPLDSVGQFAQLAEFKDQAIAYITRALEELGLDWSFLLQNDAATGADAAHRIYGKVAEESQTVAQAVTDVVVGPAVEFVLRIVVFFLLFFLIMLVVRMLVGLGKGFNRVPLVGGINRLLGLGLGLIQAAVVGYLITMALVLVVAVSGNKWELLNSQVLSETSLILWFKNLDLLSLL